MQLEKLPTRIPKLDEALAGGVPKNHLVLLTGTPGVMKSSLAFHFLYASARAGKHCGYLTLEQSAESVLTQMQLMGYALDQIRLDSNNPAVINAFGGLKQSPPGTGVLSVLDLGWERRKQKQKKTWLKAISDELEKLRARGLEVVVLDSLNVLYQLENFGEKRKDLFDLCNYLKSLGLTCIIIGEALHQSEDHFRYGFESYLVDGIIRIVSVRRNLKMVRELCIEKMRYVDHSANIFVFSFDTKKKEFKLAEKLALL